MNHTALAGASTAPAAGWLPRRHPGAIKNLLDTIQAEGGEWTVGRAKPIYRQYVGSHTYRATIRRHLELLNTTGRLDRHDEDPDRRFYTYRPEGDRR